MTIPTARLLFSGFFCLAILGHGGGALEAQETGTLRARALVVATGIQTQAVATAEAEGLALMVEPAGRLTDPVLAGGLVRLFYQWLGPAPASESSDLPGGARHDLAGSGMLVPAGRHLQVTIAYIAT